MGKASFSEEFKRDAVAQITERGYLVAEVSQRLGVSQLAHFRGAGANSVATRKSRTRNNRL